MLLQAVFFSLVWVAQLHAKASWDYSSPAEWQKEYPECGGSQQSPVDIETNRVKYDPELTVTLRNFDAPMHSMVQNNGHTVVVPVIPEGEMAVEFMGQIYNPMQFHFHWGKSHASEHTVDGHWENGEMHIVCRNQRYTQEEMKYKMDGTLVLAFFIVEGEHDNEALMSLTEVLAEVQEDSETNKAALASPLKLSEVLPEGAMDEVFHYKGSLTTPPCTEQVQWIVSRKPVTMSHFQLVMFRHLTYLSAKGLRENISGNHRPTQPLNGRTVYSNFKVVQQKQEL